VKCNALCGCWIILFDVGTERDEVIDCLGDQTGVMSV
jgi:hypothetical protein